MNTKHLPLMSPSMSQVIRIRGARVHNLQNIDLDLPRSRFIVITGLSGSGKSSLAFDTLFAEGQRRYIESLSSYARQFLPTMEKADVDTIEGISPTVSINQKTTSSNPRSTVGTVTEIQDYLRLLYARIGKPKCPVHQNPLSAKNISQMIKDILALPKGAPIIILSPMIRGRKGEHKEALQTLKARGFLRIRIDGNIFMLDSVPKINPNIHHNIDIVVDRFKVREEHRLRIAESLETCLRYSPGLITVTSMDRSFAEFIMSANHTCPECGYSAGKLEPRMFSFNSPLGACPQCEGLGRVRQFDIKKLIRPHLSLLSGAVFHWDRRNLDYCRTVTALSRHYCFDTITPFCKLPKKVRDVILYGSDDENINFSLSDENPQACFPFPGLLKNLEKQLETQTSLRLRERLKKYMSMRICSTCKGERLNGLARHVFIENTSISKLCRLSIKASMDFLDNLKLSRQDAAIADSILNEVSSRLQFLIEVGLGYLNLARPADTLSGGESQRIRLASQIGSKLVGVTYVLDEPSIGLHASDHEKLLNTLLALRDLGNNVIVVEHDEEAMRRADHIVDMGPGAGTKGGQVVAQGNMEDIIRCRASLTGDFLEGRRAIEIPAKRVPIKKNNMLSIRGASANNLKNIDVDIPLGLFVCITGVSGSGKSSLVNHTLLPNLTSPPRVPGNEFVNCTSLMGWDKIERVINIDQKPIGRTPRSNPATYTNLFQIIRDLFAATQEARSRGYRPGRFSFNVHGGRCEACEGCGLIRVEMHFLPDVYVKCEACQGKRYNEETLGILYKGHSIFDVLNMSVNEAYHFFTNIPSISAKIATLQKVGLGYISLGQSATTLSGGETQRIKLSRELSKKDKGETLYILDEPTTGLHFQDIKQLLKVLQELRDKGNTILVIEHNIDIIKTADHIIDLGPKGGNKGGQVIVEGSPKHVASCLTSSTGLYLAKVLKKKQHSGRAVKEKRCMKKESVLGILWVTGLVSLVCSLIVSATAISLRPLQEENRRTAILEAVSSLTEAAGQDYRSSDSVQIRIEQKIIDLELGEYVDNEKIANLSLSEIMRAQNWSRPLDKKEDIAQIKRLPRYMRIYFAIDANDQVRQIILPIFGYGLWSTMYAMVAVETNGQTVWGISFYEQKETPGLGGNVANLNWEKQWRGKKIFSSDGEVGLHLVKPDGRNLDDQEISALSGATITTRGVENMLHFWFGNLGYKKYLQKYWISQSNP